MPNFDDRLSRHDNNFNLVRLLAACCVIYFHSFAVSGVPGFDAVSTLVDPWSNAGGLAVGTFFFISGIFVTLSFFRKKSWVDFSLRRIFRIWPGFIFCLLVTASVACMVEPSVGLRGFWRHAPYYDYIWHNAVMKLEFFIDGVFTLHPNRAINGSIHTLVLEVKMYGFVLLLSFFGSLVARWFVGALGALGVLVSLFRPTLLATWLDAPSYGVAPIALFFMGMLLFAIARLITWRTTIVGAVVGVIMFAVLGYGILAFWITIMSLIILVGAFGPRLLATVLKHDYSYGIFLYGFPVQQLIHHFYPTVTSYPLFCLSLLTAGLMAMFSWHFIESPAIAIARTISDDLRSLKQGIFWDAPVRYLRLAWLPFSIGLVIPLGWLGSYLANRYDLAPTEKLDVKILEYGPRGTKVGEGFNQQADGSSGMWFVLDKSPPVGTKVRIGNERCDTIIGADNVAVCRVPDHVFARPTTIPVALELRTARKIFRTPSVEFTVSENFDILANRDDLVPTEKLEVKILEYGPRGTNVGKGFNQQADGSSGMWFVLDKSPPVGTKVRIGNERCDTIIGGSNVVTCRVPNHVFSHPATIPVMLELRTARRNFQTSSVDFTVSENLDILSERYDLAIPENLDVKILKYGPHGTKVGEAFNRQTDGSSAMWFVLDKSPPAGTKVRIGKVRCETIIGADNVVTCRVPDHVLARPATVPVVLELYSEGRKFQSSPVDFIVSENSDEGPVP